MVRSSHVGQNGHIVSWGTNLDRKKESAMAEPPQADTLLTPAEVAATVYRGLGIDTAVELPGAQGRPIPLVDRGVEPIRELFR